MQEMRLRHGHIWRPWLHGPTHRSHDLPRLPQHSPPCRRRRHRRCSPQLQLSCRQTLPPLRFRPHTSLGSPHLPPLWRRDATHWRLRILDVRSQPFFCFFIIFTLNTNFSVNLYLGNKTVLQKNAIFAYWKIVWPKKVRSWWKSSQQCY